MGKIWVATGKSRLEVVLLPVPQSPSIARVFVRHQLISLGYHELIDNACQIASEIVSNAVTAVISTGPKTRGSIRLSLDPNHGRPLLEVWDPCPEMPVMSDPDFLEESGRGLHIVRSLAAGFGWRKDEERGEKVVWALLR